MQRTSRYSHKALVLRAAIDAIAINLDPYRFGLGSRGSVSLYATNVLVGLDLLIHGANRLHGWGAPATPDPVLLHVRGFDPASGRYVYAINPNFGRGRRQFSSMLAPFQIALDVRLDIGPNRERELIRSRMLSAAEGSDSSPLSPKRVKRYLMMTSESDLIDDIKIVLRLADSLKLSQAQQKTIIAADQRFSAFRDSVYSEVTTYLLAHNGDFGDDLVDTWHLAMTSIIKARFGALTEVRDVMKPAQIAWIRAIGVAPALDNPEVALRRALRGPLGPQ
jgi:hypothetical protein